MNIKHDESNDKRVKWAHLPPLTGLGGSNFHDDETFMNVSMNLIARREGLSLTPRESIESVLICSDDQLAYYEALRTKLSQLHSVGAYLTGSMIQRLDQEFSAELRDLCSTQISGQGFATPMAPRNGHNTDSFNFFLGQRKTCQTRRFFPEMEPKSSRQMNRSIIRNFDWHLSNAVQQVVSLSLDGTSVEKRDCPCYTPPSPVHFRAP